MYRKQTLLRPVFLSGLGVHSGERVDLTLKPSLEGRIFFRRADLGGLQVEVDPRKIDARNCSCLVFDSGRIQTLEHLSAALHILGIESVEIVLHGGEIPILDGSAAPLAEAILGAGVNPLPQKGKSVRILKSHTIRQEGSSLSFGPDPDFRITYAIDFPHPVIGRQEISFSLTRKLFLEEVAPARTFGFLKDVAGLRQRGLALGGSLDNAVVLDEEKVISGPLRFKDEFVRHKVLDLIGDLALFGLPLCSILRPREGAIFSTIGPLSFSSTIPIPGPMMRTPPPAFSLADGHFLSKGALWVKMGRPKTTRAGDHGEGRKNQKRRL
jgi:UDP-3-O-[3-hydroxymyristoyl] N-acetylglucosamine deacetylase